AVVILGGGVIGSSIAYHITLLNKDPNLKVTVVEQTAIGCAASGPLQDLARKSFQTTPV
ncbi:14169_t:CDS:2, partial [Racocetra fulgida]